MFNAICLICYSINISWLKTKIIDKLKIVFLIQIVHGVRKSFRLESLLIRKYQFSFNSFKWMLYVVSSGTKKKIAVIKVVFSPCYIIYQILLLRSWLTAMQRPLVDKSNFFTRLLYYISCSFHSPHFRALNNRPHEFLLHFNIYRLLFTFICELINFFQAVDI